MEKMDIDLQTLKANNEEKFNILINRLGLNTYEYVDSASNYEEAIEKLEKSTARKSTEFMLGGCYRKRNKEHVSQWTTSFIAL